jgi:hypothetical protein
VLGLVRDKLAALASTEPERHLPAEIAAARLLIRMPSRAASARAAAIVRNSFERPLPEMSAYLTIVIASSATYSCSAIARQGQAGKAEHVEDGDSQPRNVSARDAS